MTDGRSAQPLRRRGDRVSGGPAMSSRRWLAVLSLVLALAGCVQAATGQAGAPKMPPPMEKTGNVPEHGGGDGGGGGAGM
jgi:hypothetical protein